MCLAIYKPRGVSISRKYLESGYDENPHGCGFAYAVKGKLVVSKDFKDFGEFYKALKGVQHHPMLIHFRWATHGSKTVANTHPFLINRGSHAVIHNGCLNIKTVGDKSDTRMFCERVLEPMFKVTDFADEALRFLVEGNIGCGNKIAVLRADGKHVIFNEKVGHWHKGAWYSNYGYTYGGKRRYSQWLTPVKSDAKATTDKMWENLGYPKQGEAWPTVITEPDADELAAEASKDLGMPDYEGRSFELLDNGTGTL